MISKNDEVWLTNPSLVGIIVSLLESQKEPDAKLIISSSAEGFNPLCGDQLKVYLNLEDGTVKKISFEGSAYAISKAAASMMTQAVKGKSKQEAEKLFNEVHGMVTG